MGKRAKPTKQTRYQTIVTDLASLGYDFRINDLDESLEYSVSNEGDWARVTDVIESVIRTDLRELGYGVSGSGKSGFSAQRDATLTLAHKQRFNAVHHYFKSLDGKYEPSGNGPYVIEQYAKCFQNPDGMFARWLFRWMVGAIAKIFVGERNPMLALDGPQYIGKSSFAKWICPIPRLFLRDSINPDDKDSHLRLADTLIWEVAEADATTRKADAAQVKSFLSLDHVQKRPAYGRHTIDKPAVCSFIGTINFDGSGFLVDTTGNSRFLTCLITAIDWQTYTHLYPTPDQLWAEAYWFYKNVPNSWKLTKPEEEKRDQINQGYEVPSALEEVVLDRFEITLAPTDFLPTQEIKDHLSLHYRINSEQMFTRELARTMKKLGVVGGRETYQDNEHHRRGYKGIKKREQNV